MSSQSIDQGSNRSLPILACVGFGLLLAWKHVNISPTLLDGTVSAVILDLRQGGLATAPLFIVVPLLLGLLSNKGIRLPERSLGIAVTALLGAGMAALYLVPKLPDIASLVLGNACALLSAILLLYWAKLLCETLPDNPLLYSSITFSVCFSVSLLTTYLPGPAQVAIHAILPVISGLMLVVLHGCAAKLPERPALAPTPASAKLPLRLFAGLAIITLCIDMTNIFSELKTAHPNERVLLVVGLLVSLVIFALTVKRSQQHFAESFKLVLVILVASMFFVLIFEFEQRIYETATLALGGTLFRIFFYATICAVLARTSKDHLYVLGIGQAVITATQFLDPYVAQAVMGVSSVTIIAIMTIVTIVTIIFLLGEKYLTSLLTSKVTYLDIQDEAACRRCTTTAAQKCGFTNREEQIALLVLQRKDNAEIHELLFIAPSTLQVHLRSIYKKVDVHSRAELITYLESLAGEE